MGECPVIFVEVEIFELPQEVVGEIDARKYVRRNVLSIYMCHPKICVDLNEKSTCKCLLVMLLITRLES